MHAMSNARQVSLDADGNLRYGGTPSDDAVLRLIAEIKNRGLKICFYPMLMMDIVGKPWRGRLTSNDLANINANIPNFFTRNFSRNCSLGIK